MKQIIFLILISAFAWKIQAQDFDTITLELRGDSSLTYYDDYILLSDLAGVRTIEVQEVDTFSLESAFTLNKYLFDTTQVIIFYADTSSYEIQLYDGISETIISRGGIIYWILGYETEGIFLDERKKPISTNIIVIDYKPLK